MIRSGHSRRAELWVMSWVDRYTLGLPTEVASDRRDEIVSDMADQRADLPSGADDRRMDLAILGRAARGAVADLSWRRTRISRLSGAEATAFSAWRTDRRVGGLTVVCGTLMTLWCVAVLVRISMGVDRGDIPIAGAGAALVLGFAAVCLCGTLLSMRGPTRWIGALWLLAASPFVLGLGLDAVYATSATATSVAYDPAFAIGTGVLSAALGLFCLASAVWHFPFTSSPTAPHRNGSSS